MAGQIVSINYYLDHLFSCCKIITFPRKGAVSFNIYFQKIFSLKMLFEIIEFK